MDNASTQSVPTLKAAWRLIEPFWIHGPKWKAYGLLALVIAGTVMGTMTNARMIQWAGKSMDALTHYEAASYWQLYVQWAWLLLALLVFHVVSTFANRALHIEWRTWLTDRFLQRWLARETFYRIEREQTVDNPDQRITEDIDQLITHSFNLSVGLFSTVLRLGTFASLLWVASGPLAFTLLGTRWTVPGYMVWIAVIYAAVMTGLTHLVGHRLMRVNFNKQRVEADFRFTMVGVREHAEQIALYHGAQTEIRRMQAGFMAVRRNFWQVLRVSLPYEAFQMGMGLILSLVPAVLVAPRYFSREITYGGMTQVTLAFVSVYSSLSWFVSYYETLQLFRVVVKRLYGLERACEVVTPVRDGVDYAATPQGNLIVTDLVLRTPHGAALNRPVDLVVAPGQRWLVKGESGVGKSTLMRGLAGIWPYGKGQIRMPAEAGILFLSQKNYLPPGTLKAALCYPAEESAYSDEACQHALVDACLPVYVARLHETDRWSQRMSPGEQQRLAIGRALLQRPDFLFLDESTSALDPATERVVYQTLLRVLPACAIVHVSHRPSLDEFHDRVLQVQPAESGERMQLVA
ncbi:ABC transporter ATP-binding protein/permease [Undibacterium sp.]|jgi:putative ATP-binding cassette transporter|uniref:ABC transporter ATP-binding protein/permease n=1 Tax=Undibacterium sp. TaxID=1914977 RepID=UPI002BF3A0C4|nr:ABC transporter ATP-binding protein/permease [Undibacterium sp.]HTD03879.1 ABC transporter ATP-binding protein/permease [Undibacterium sp.]